MATNKNQHFVPRCYLNAFTRNGENMAINLLNLDRELCISDAPVKNQCSGDYFYGQDHRLEEAIRGVESEYAAAVARIHTPGYKLADSERVVLRIFMLFQYLRTEAASLRSVEMFEGMKNVIDPDMPDFKPSMKEAVQMAMRNFADVMHIIDDLKVCLLHNRTSRPFVTSDDPSVMTNRWHMEDRRVRHKSPGLISCGAIFFLPLSPQVVCMAYDGDVYSVSHEGGWTDLRRDRDVVACNEQQFLNAQANIYFREWEHREWVLICCRAIIKQRLPCHHRVNYAILDRIEGDHKVYRAVKRDEAGDHSEALIHTQSLMPRPTSWPTQLRFRGKGYVYTNGTGAGYIRAAQTSSRSVGGYWKEPA